MKMRFNVATLSFLICASVYAGTYQDAFEANRDSVLAGQCISVDDVFFGIGIGIPRGSSVAQQEAAVAKARLSATVNLLCRKAASSIVWPVGLDRKYQAQLSAYVARELTMSCKVEGLETVYVGQDTNGVRTAVVAVNVKALSSVPRATLADAQRILLRPLWMKKHFHACRDALCAFYQTQKALPESLQGVDPATWTETQIDTFCGVKPDVKETVTAESAKESKEDDQEEETFLPQFILPPYATDNENETIGF